MDVRKGAWLGLADGAAVASGNDFGPVAEAVVERLLEGGRELLTLLTGADEPPLAALVARDRRRATRTSRSRSTPAASRTTPSPLGGIDVVGEIRVLLAEDNEVYRSTLELLLDGRDGI